MKTTQIADVDRAILKMNEAKRALKLSKKELDEYLLEEGLLCEATVERAEHLIDELDR